jgi:hypothetical protein
VMKQSSDGRRAMRTAWELAVTRSLQHPNVIMVRAWGRVTLIFNYYYYYYMRVGRRRSGVA